MDFVKTRKGKIRLLAGRLLEQPIVLRLMMLTDRILLKAALAGKHTESNQHAILNSPGEGNIGDQAMFESFISNVRGNVLAVVKSTDAYVIPEDHRSSNVAFLVLPDLVYSKFASHYRDVWRFGRSMRGATSFSVMGADIMDGGYGLRSSMVEWNLALAVQQSGIPARILGFSWNGKAHAEVIKLARKSGVSGVRILPRDPDSLERLQMDRVSNVTLSSDMVFAFPNKSDSTQAPGVSIKAKKTAVVNVSGLIGLRIAQEEEYEHLMEILENLGYESLLLPHVSHSNVDDIAATERLRERSGVAGRARFVRELISPSEVQSLVRNADVVVTGRMHLSILALSVGTPVIVLATQGKVSGLMKLFGIPEHCVEPTKGFGKRVASLLIDLENDRQTLTGRINAHLPAVKELSSINFHHS